MIKPLGNNIIFKFLYDTDSDTGMFQDQTESGIQILKNHEDTTKSPRWGKIVALGSEVTDISLTDYILIEPLMWTDSVTHDGSKYWSTNIDKIMCVSETNPETSL